MNPWPNASYDRVSFYGCVEISMNIIAKLRDDLAENHTQQA